MTQILYTRHACIQILDTLHALKAENAKRVDVLHERAIHTENDLVLVQKIEGFINSYEELIYERIAEIDKEGK